MLAAQYRALSAVITSSELAHHKDFILQNLLRPSFQLIPQNKKELLEPKPTYGGDLPWQYTLIKHNNHSCGVSRLGGDPDVPKDFVWPLIHFKNENNENKKKKEPVPYRFLGQINFADAEVALLTATQHEIKKKTQSCQKKKRRKRINEFFDIFVTFYLPTTNTIWKKPLKKDYYPFFSPKQRTRTFSGVRRTLSRYFISPVRPLLLPKIIIIVSILTWRGVQHPRHGILATAGRTPRVRSTSTLSHPLCCRKMSFVSRRWWRTPRRTVKTTKRVFHVIKIQKSKKQNCPRRFLLQPKSMTVMSIKKKFEIS
ncbi:hypothetical protein AGDE_16852 [Angomonas deanei]|nr:hypothetical protein AGDE_16852 [Angomonas deanei]|eukprot:EPY16052.1 hypothetical protein AGDE_16852 [Angomonas deanei]